MRKIKFLLSTLVLLLGAVTASAAEYTVDFNTAINTSDHAFQVASNWRHIVGSYIDYWDNTSYPSYSYSTTAGVDGTGALSCSTNQSSNGIYDLLVTPVVKGTVTIAAKQTDSYYTPLLEFYKIIDNGDGTFTRGDKIDVDVSAINTTDYVTITIPVDEAGERIGIRSSYVWLDNFTATEATIVPEPKITIASAVPSATTGTIYWEQQPNGKVLVSYTVTVTNTGDVALTQGMDGYSVSIINRSTGDVYATTAVPQDLAIGATSDPFVVSAEVETSLWPNSYTYINMDLKENIFGSTVQRAQSHYKAYEPKFVFRTAGSSSTSNLSSAEAWGTIKESTTKNYEIFNNGTAPLIVNSIAIPEDFTTDPAGTDVVLFRTSGYNADGAIWYAWTWNTDDGVWVPETDGKFTGLKNNVIFVRMKPAAAGNPDWSYEWNRTGDLTVEPGKTYVIDSWGANYGDPVVGHWAAAVVAKGETKAINITNDASVTGTFAGNLVIKHLDKDAVEQTYTLAFSTTVIDPNTWTADFNNTTSTVVYPAGSIAEAGIISDYQFISSGNYNNWLVGRSNSSYANANNKFITPLLHANAGEKLTFNVKRGESGSATYNIKVYVSTDRKTWGDPVFTMTAADMTSSFQTKDITFDAEGDYYVAFALYGVCLDDLIGLTKVDVAHDLYIKSVSWPSASINSGAAQSKPSVDIIPLTDETAEAYTVKYVCGETVLAEGTPIALTASANSSKTFSFNWTPNVESTSVYENTKVVFDFGSGVTFETEGFDLTIVKEPKFHFVKTLPSSKWNEPSNYTTPITFGKTNTADTQTFYVNNWGTAPLTVKSIVMPEGFTVTPDEQFVVAAYDQTNEGIAAASQAVTITFSTTTPGEYSGNMVITYVDGLGNDQTFEIAVSGTKLDPTKWYATFDDGNNNSVWPAGSVYNGLSLTNGGTYSVANYYATGNGMFVTPKMTVAAGDKITFDAKLYSSSSYYADGSVTVYVASTRDEVMNAEEGTTRTQVFKVSGEDTENPIATDFQTFEVTFADAGEYYIGFDLYNNVKVDEIYGLTPVAVEHDWMIASSNIPADAMQNVVKNASVNLLNLGLADEAADSYEVNLYIGGEKTATAATTLALPMTHQLSAAGTQITVPMQSPKAGTFPVYIEVKAGTYSIATEPVSVTFAEEEAKSEADMATNGTTYEVPLYLNYKNSESVTMYNADALAAAGISAGTKIKKITYKGYKTTDEQTTSFQVYYKWTDDQTLTQPATTYPFAAEDNGMTKLIDEDHTWAKVGSSSELGEMIVLDFTDSPLTYEAGKSLVIYMHSYVDGYKTAYFEKSTLSSDYCYTRKADAASLSASFSKATPAAIHFTLAVEPKTYSGTVKDDSGNAIENATVTLVSIDGDNIQYTGTTNAAGEFSINVIQTARTYNATVSAYGYGDATDADISFDTDVDKDFTLEVSVTVTAAGWATITTPATYAVSFDEKTEVYIATANNDESITLKKISDAPAMTPVVIHASEGSYTMTKIENATSIVTDNILQSSDGTQVGDGNGNYYVLGMQNAGVGFGPLANGVTLAKGKAYLVPTSPSGFLTFVIGDEDETTTINAVDAAGMDDDTPVYNLAGQKVGKDYKGVVIVNGRKVVRK